MKRMKRISVFSLCLTFACLPFFFYAGCGTDGASSSDYGDGGSTAADSTGGSDSQGGGQASYCNVYPVSYDEVNRTADMTAFYGETTQNGQGSGASYDGKLDYGFVDSVWHKLTVGGTEVSVYSARCGYGIHSFAWVDVDTDGRFSLDVTLDLLTDDKESVTVLPEKAGVSAEYEGGRATAAISDFGSYSFVFDGEADKAVTLYVAPYSEPDVPEGWQTKTFEPGAYGREETLFTETNTVYLFKSGVYDVTSFSLPSDSVLYFERGVYIRVYEAAQNDYYSFMTSSGTHDVKVLGRAIVDFSGCTGGDAKTKGAYDFSNAENVEIEGLISVNSNNWTMCASNSRGVNVSRCMFFSYRTYSDGVMFSDCKDSSAKDCFVRTGDDAMEVKAFSQSTSADCYTDNVVFENNCVWTDKGIGYGCIYEARHDVQNVVFRNNSIGFAQASWSEHLGCCTVQMGSDKNALWQDVHFENIEVYKTSCALLSVFNRAVNADEGGKIKNIYFENITAKYAVQKNLPVYCLSVVIRLGEGAENTNCTIGALYLDNIRYAGEEITSDNFENYTNISLDSGARFAKSSIKINKLTQTN